jgi:hypothetical protein
MWIMIAAPYRAGTSNPDEWTENLRNLNDAARAVFVKGHVPVIGVNMALPIIATAGEESYEQIMMPLSLRLTERCDAVLRIGGTSKGADDEVERFMSRGLPVFKSSNEIPDDLKSPASHCHELQIPETTCYVRFSKSGGIAGSTEIGTTSRGEKMIADVDAEGRVIGVELIAPELKPCQR